MIIQEYDKGNKKAVLRQNPYHDEYYVKVFENGRFRVHTLEDRTEALNLYTETVDRFESQEVN